ncbi:MAG: NAD-dependent succinate-semialdehyde dehydrogenase [Aquabacterium sp.]
MLGLQDNPLIKRQAYVNGLWTDSLDGSAFVVRNPANQQDLALVPDMGVTDVSHAISAAQAAFHSWKALPAKVRAQHLRAWFDLMVAHQEDLATLMTLEQGKPLAEARSEVTYGAAFVEWFAEEAKRVNGETIPAPTADKRLLVIKQPVGVVAAITPWNFPVAMITRKAAAALAAGCTIVVKPAEATPLCALALAELAHRAGIPPGVFNVITTQRPAEVGQAITDDPRVRKLSFTGSTRIGKQLMAACAGTVKKVSLELGGNAPFIVFEDADLDAAVAGAIQSKFRNAGQTCVCTNRFLVQRSVLPAFTSKFLAAVQGLHVAPGDQAGSQIGPLISTCAIDKVDRLVQDAIAQGAQLLCGGHRHSAGAQFYAPTVLTDVTPSMAVAREEIFGPVAPIMAFDTEAEAVDLANQTSSGLAAYFYARDIGRVWRMAEQLACGIVGINEGIISNEMAPFGGVKESGIGREGSHHGIDEYLEMKYLCMGGL